MLGTWEIAKMKKSSLPEKVASGFSEATKNLKGAKYRPVLYCKAGNGRSSPSRPSCKGSNPVGPFGAAWLQG